MKLERDRHFRVIVVSTPFPVRISNHGWRMVCEVGIFLATAVREPARTRGWKEHRGLANRFERAVGVNIGLQTKAGVLDEIRPLSESLHEPSDLRLISRNALANSE